jgi:hypothetical protein
VRGPFTNTVLLQHEIVDLVDMLFLLHFLCAGCASDRWESFGGEHRREWLEDMLDIMAGSDDNGCQGIGSSKTKVISF